MNMNLVSENVVCVFSVFNKQLLKFDPLNSFFQDEIPHTFSIPDPFAPVIIQYPKNGFDIIFVENKLTIQKLSKLPNPLPELAKTVLTNTGEQQMVAYGFNYNFSLPEINQKTHEVLGLKEKLLQIPKFQYLPRAFVKLSYSYEGLVLQIDFKDVESHEPNVHVNVHFNESISTAKLAEILDNKYKEAEHLAQELIREVTMQ